LALSTGPEALQNAIAAAELYMQAMQKGEKTMTAAERGKISRRCNDLLALAERLKANARAAAQSGQPPVPESTRILPAAEMAILLRSSRLHGNVFPPWESEPAPETFLQISQDGSPVFT
jgi:calpain-7